MKIAVTNNQDFTPEQKQRLEGLGDVTYFDEVPESAKEYLKRVEGADIICSGTAGLKQAQAELKDVYVTVGFVSVAFLDLEMMAKNGVKVSNAPGINRHAVTEWIVFMMLQIQRNFNDALNRKETYRINGALPPNNPGLTNKKLTILGNGNISKQLARVAESFDMQVTAFKRGDDLRQTVKDADIVVDTLGVNKETTGLLDKDFFAAMKQSSSFISVTRSEICNEDALIQALDSNHLHMAAMDCGGVMVGDTEDPLYEKLLNHPRILATPHIAYSSETSFIFGNDTMIDNVQAWIGGEPQNLLN